MLADHSRDSAPAIEWRIERFEALDSTNSLALQRVRDSWQTGGESPHGLVICADRQRAGKGQHGRAWESPAGGLYLSAVVEQVREKLRPVLALLAGVAVAHALRNLDLPVKLQWPNDLMLGGKKLGGILCEAAASGSRWTGIIGIGLNVNTDLAELPAVLRPRATSLQAHTGRRHDPRIIEHYILTELSDVLTSAGVDGLERVIENARGLDALHGQWVQLQNGDELVSGAAVGIGDSGELLLNTGDGVRPFASGSIISVNGQRLRG